MICSPQQINGSNFYFSRSRSVYTTRWNYSQCLLQLRNLWCWNHGWGFAEKGFGDSLKVTFHFREQFTSIHWESSQFRCLEPLRKIFWLISNGSLLVFLVCRPHTWKKNTPWEKLQFHPEANPTFTHHKLCGDLRKLVSFTRGRSRKQLFSRRKVHCMAYCINIHAWKVASLCFFF